MNYLDIVNLIFTILFSLYGLVMLHFVVFAIVGIFAKKKYPVTDKFNRYGLIIPARNEELVVGGLIESIQKTLYPQDKLEIFVIAHNCTDKTAEIARSFGPQVHVYEYNNPNECTMGYAFRYLFDQIEKDFGRQNFDGFFLFNADNIVAPNYFNKMNDAFEYYGHKSVVTSFRNSKNFGSNTISGLYGIYFSLGCFSESRGRTVCGCSTRVQGTGYVIPAETVKNGWPYVTLTEDWEFSADQVINENRINYCDEAIFYDEQPTTFKIMWRQRVRWSRGHLLVFNTRVKDLFGRLFARKNNKRGSTYDILVNCLPFGLIMTGLAILQVILTLFCPLFGISLHETFLGVSDPNASFIMHIINAKGFLYTTLRSVIMGYIGSVITAIVVFILGHKRIKNVSLPRKIWLTIVWPLFLFIQFPMDVQALFSKNLGWKVIPHQDKTRIGNLH